MRYKFELKESIFEGYVQFTVSMTSIPSVKEGSEECLKAKAQAETLLKNLKKYLGDLDGNVRPGSTKHNDQTPADGSSRHG
jgi:hypothetical protein